MSEKVQEQLLALVTRVVESPITEASLDEFYGQLEKLGSSPEVMVALVETFWLLWIKLDGTSNGLRRAGLVELMRASFRDKKVERKVAMEVLDGECMQAAGLVDNAELWRKKEIRYNTKALYTVAKYNLVREDSEGYAKLLVALNHFGDAALEPGMVPHLYKEIQTLIGYFDLDPNRVLDLVLDAAEMQPHNKAYMRLVPLFKKEAVVHLLGFKFQHYHKPDVAPAWPNLPLLAASLISDGLVELEQLMPHLAPQDDEIAKAQEATMAELRKEVENIGIINLNAPVAAEADKEVPATGGGGGGNGLRAALVLDAPARAPMMLGTGMGGGPQGTGLIAMMRSAQQGQGLHQTAQAPHGISGMQGPMGGGGYGEERGGGLSLAATGFRPANQLRADALCLDPALKYEALLLPRDAARNQKLALAQALLQVGAYDVAHVLISHLSSLGMQPAAWAPLSATLAHAVTEELAPVLDRLAPRALLAQGLLDAALNVMARSGLGGGSAGIIAGLPAHLAPGPPVSPRAMEALKTLGPFLGRNPRLLTKVIQAMRHHYLFYCIAPGGQQQDSTAPDSPLALEAAKVEEVVGRVLLPASCLVPCMPALSMELWQLLKLLPFGTRYRLYAELKDQVERHPYLSAAHKMAMYETRKVLKRLHSAPDKKDLKDACKPHGRMLAKIAAANPWTVLEVLVSTVEAYPNQLEPVVEALKYLTPLAFDALTYVILSHLSMDREKVKDDGTNISDWLQSLAKFSGAVCRKYQEVDIFSLCQFLANALRGADSFDLLVLKELVETLTGISVVVELSAEQLEGKLGGEALSSYVLMKDVDKSRKAWARGGRRLLEALQRGPPRQQLALPLFILVAQQRQAIMIHTGAQHIKFVVGLYDKCHETCTQYIEFLQSALTFEDYQSLLPGIQALRLEYNLDPEVVFMAHRPILRRLLHELQQASPEEGEIEAAEGAGGGPEAGEMDVDSGAGAPAIAGVSAGAGGPDAATAARAAAANAAWQAMLEVVRVSAPNQSVWEATSPHLYTLFWALTVNDIYVPTRTYEVELEKAKAELRGVEARLSSARMAGPNAFNALTEDELVELGKQRDRLKALVSRLPVEMESQADSVRQTIALLTRDKDRLLGSTKRTVAAVLVSECVLPRLLCSPTDACYCAKFVEVLHNLSVPFFSTVWYLNQLIHDVIPALRCLTDHEAVNMGVFLLESFRLINHWRSSEKVYEDECKCKPGFAISLTGGPQDDRRTSYEQYRKLVFKWHRIALATIKSCLESSEYTSRRNVLTVLNRMLPVFPVADKHWDDLRKTLDKVRALEQREDLQVSLKSYAAAMEAEAGKPNRVVTAEAFGEPPAVAKAKKAGAGGPGRSLVANGTASTGSPAGRKTAVASAAPAAAGRPPAAAPAAAAPAPARLRPEALEFKLPAQAGSAPAAATAAAAGAAVGERPEVEEGRASKRMKAEPAAHENGAQMPSRPSRASADVMDGGAVLVPVAAEAPATSRPAPKREPPAANSTAAAQPGAGIVPPSSKRARVEAPEPPKGDRPAPSSTTGSGGAVDRDSTGRDGAGVDGMGNSRERRGKEPREHREKDRSKDKEREGRDKEGKDRDKEPKEFKEKEPKEYKDIKEPKEYKEKEPREHKESKRSREKEEKEPKEPKEKEREKDKAKDKKEDRRDKEVRQERAQEEPVPEPGASGRADAAQEERARPARRGSVMGAGAPLRPLLPPRDQEAGEGSLLHAHPPIEAPRARSHEPIQPPLSRENSSQQLGGRDIELLASAGGAGKRGRHGRSKDAGPDSTSPPVDLRTVLQRKQAGVPGDGGAGTADGGGPQPGGRPRGHRR